MTCTYPETWLESGLESRVDATTVILSATGALEELLRVSCWFSTTPPPVTSG
jgi:hypothetical protein